MAYELPDTSDEAMAKAYADGDVVNFQMLMGLRLSRTQEATFKLQERSVIALEQQSECLRQLVDEVYAFRRDASDGAGRIRLQ